MREHVTMTVTKLPLAIVSTDKDLIDLIRHCDNYDLIGVFDANPGANTGGVKIFGPDERFREILSAHPGMRVAMAIDPPKLKRKLTSHYGIENLATIIPRDAYIASSAILGPGCVIQRGATILPDVRLGTACKVNVGATIHHDCLVGDFCTIAPGSQLLGNVIIGDDVYVGAGAIVLPRIKIGAGAIIGAGAVVTSDAPPD